MDSFDHVVNEKELLTLLQQSDEAAYTEIYNLYWKPCYFVAAQKLGNLFEAEEVVQDIFLNLWRRREQLQIQTCLSSYLFNSIKYQVINILAKRLRDVKYRRELVDSIQPDCSTEQQINLHELQDKLFRERCKLPEKCRLIFEMSREEGFSQKQIATKLKISQKTVESHIGRALRTLRTSLGSLMLLL